MQATQAYKRGMRVPQEVVTGAVRSVSAPLRGTEACVLLTEEPTDRERDLSSFAALNPFSAARLAAIDCPLQELLALDAADQVCDTLLPHAHPCLLGQCWQMHVLASGQQCCWVAGNQ